MSELTLQGHRRSRVLVADDTESIRLLFRRLLTADGHDVIVAADGAAALDAVRRQQPDVILLDVTMPAIDGLEVCRRLKSDPATRLTPIVLVTGQTDLSDRIRGIEAGADEFLSKPVHPHELRARVRSLARVKHLIDALDSAEAAFMTLALTIEARDPYTKGHCERLARHAVRLGRALGVPADDLEALHRGGYLHDVGKVGIPDAVLRKPGRYVLIDATGRDLEPISEANAQAYLVIEGPGASRQVPVLSRLLEAAPALAEKIDGAEWVGNRRWNLTFETGQVLALPEGKQEAGEALAEFARLEGMNQLLDGQAVAFDMRVKDRITMRIPGRSEPKPVAVPAEKSDGE